MYISKVRVTRFKSYHDSGEIEFKPGFNIVVGPNSAGKTALLEAMQLQFQDNAHRSLKTVPFFGAALTLGSSVQLTFSVTKEEFLRAVGSPDLFFASPRALNVPGFGSYVQSNEGAQAFLKWLLDRCDFQITIECRANGYLVPVPDRFGLYQPEPVQPNGLQPFLHAKLDLNGHLSFINFTALQEQLDVTFRVAGAFRNRIYRFLAERFNFGDSPVGTNRTLRPNAENLPEVLDLLKANPARMDRFNHIVHEILPQVQHISVTKVPASDSRINARILVWPTDYKKEREDLAHPLNECGSGVGQVLAILYVVINSNEPQTILIDEPQSFLHPGAVRKLIEVLKSFPQHQYIIATHSPAVVSAADPATLTALRTEEGESKIELIDPRNTRHARALLAELGARLSDVFGADNIIWVEGQTEEECFPIILRRVAKKSLMGTALVGIKRTGDLQGRDKRKWMELYHKLSQANSLVPPTIAFAFDSECLTADQKKELAKLAPGRVHFLPRRMYENYLLDPEAIAAIVNAIPGFRDHQVSPEEIWNWLDGKLEERKGKDAASKQLRYFCGGIDKVPNEWEREVDGTGLLEDLFRDLSETRVPFEKTTHSLELTEWLAAHNPNALKEVAEFVASLLAPA